MKQNFLDFEFLLGKGWDFYVCISVPNSDWIERNTP